MIAAETVQERPAHWFTSSNAREMRQRGVEAKAKRAEIARQVVETATLDPNIDYSLRRLARVRLQLDRLDAMLLAEKDAQKLDRLASAIARLNEQERQLSNRSMPPVVRASAKSPRQRPGQGSFHEPEVLPDPVANPPAIETPKPATDTPTGGVQ